MMKKNLKIHTNIINNKDLPPNLFKFHFLYLNDFSLPSPSFLLPTLQPDKHCCNLNLKTS